MSGNRTRRADGETPTALRSVTPAEPTELERVHGVQKRRVLRALLGTEALDATPILADGEAFTPDEYETLVYELHHVHLPELEAAGLVEFDPRTDLVTRGRRFDELCPGDDAP